MHVHNIYSDADGVSHFRDIEIDWVDDMRSSKRSKTFQTSGMVFRETAGDFDLDWHPAPRRQFVINLDGGVEITVGDGEQRVIEAGEVLLVEDTTGKGHISRALRGVTRHSVIIVCE